MAPSARFWDKIAPRYARNPIADQASYEHKLELTQALFNPDMQVLEVGCGTGTTALIHAPFVAHILATDLSSGMLDIARAKAKKQGVDNVTFQQTSIEALDLDGASMDVVMAHSLLHLVEDRDAAIARVFTILKPGGYFVSSTACLKDFNPLMRGALRIALPPARWLGLVPPVSFFSVEELVEGLRQAGFTIEHQWQPAKGKAVFVIARRR